MGDKTSPLSEPIIYAARTVIPVTGQVLAPGYVQARGSVIETVAEGVPPAGSGWILDFGDAAILPAFINAHTHLGCGFLKGMPTGDDFCEWMTEGVAPRVIAAANGERERIAEGARNAAEEALEGGQTFLVDSFFLDVGLDAMSACGLEGYFAREFFGASAPDIDGYAEEAAATARRGMGNFGRNSIGFALAPHAPYTCPDRVLRALAAVAREKKLLMTIHLAESAAEREMFEHSKGPMYDIFARDGRASRYALGRSSVAAVDEAGVLGPRTLAVHAVHLDRADIEILARTGTQVVHCPISNQRLGVGLAPVRALVDQGVNVCLGTDSAASNGKLDLFAEMRGMLLAQRTARGGQAFTAAEALEMTTIRAARALGVEAKRGSLEPGKIADLMVVRLDRPRHRPVPDPVSAVVWSASAADVRAVMIRGMHYYEAGE